MFADAMSCVMTYDIVLQRISSIVSRMMTGNIPTTDEIDAMTDQQYKVLENRLRRAAARQGLRLEKSHARDPQALTHGTYCLIEGPPRNGDNWRSRLQVAGDPHTGYGLGLDDVARYLYGEQTAADDE